MIQVHLADLRVHRPHRRSWVAELPLAAVVDLAVVVLVVVPPPVEVLPAVELPLKY